MKKILLGSLAGALIMAAGSAMAADMARAPVYRAPAEFATVYSWTGFYVGGNAGYAWGSADSTLSIVDGPGGACHFACAPANDLNVAQAAGSSSFSPKGFTGGGQFGYNWQASNWVYGLEVDFGAFQQRQTITNGVSLATNTATGFNCNVNPCAGSFSSSMNTGWLVTFRPRIGYAWDRSLVYGTGGLAVTELSFSQSYHDNIDFFSLAGGSEAALASKTVAGWTIGGGFEQALSNNWSVRAEYLYTRFGGFSATGQLTDGTGGVSIFTNNVGAFSSNVVRGGVNYKF